MIKNLKFFRKSFSSKIDLKPNKCYYKTLLLSPDQPFGDIKQSYLILAKKYHPDISKEEGHEVIFQEI